MGKKGAKKTAPKSSKSLSPVEAFVKEVSSSQSFKGVAQVQMASDVKSTYLLRRSTGILSQDIALGGGLHSGGTVEVHGSESVGKTHWAFRVAGQVQQTYGHEANILVYLTETRLDKGFARKSQFCVPYSDEEIAEYEKLRKDRGDEPFTKEEKEDLRMCIGNVVFIFAATADKGLDVILKALDAGVFQLVIIESLGAFLTEQQDDKNVGEATVAGSAGIVTKFQNKAYPKFIMDRPDGTLLETTVIGVSQARANVGGGPKAPKSKSSTGAFSWRHGQLVNIELRRGQNITDGKDVIGHEVHWKLTKGKLGTHDGKKGSYDYYHMKREDPVFWSKVQEEFNGVDVMRDVVETAKNLGIIANNGSWFEWEGFKVQGIEAMGAEIERRASEDPAVMEKLWEQCMKAAGINVRYR